MKITIVSLVNFIGAVANADKPTDLPTAPTDDYGLFDDMTSCDQSICWEMGDPSLVCNSNMCCREGESGTTLHDNIFYVNFQENEKPDNVSCENMTPYGKISSLAPGQATEGQPMCFPIYCELDKHNNRVIVHIMAGRKSSGDVLVGFKNELVRAHKDGVNHMLFLNKDNVATSTLVHMFQALGVLGIGALSVGAVVGLAGLAAAAAGIEAGAAVVYGSAETLFTIPEEAMALEGSRLQVLFGNLFGDDMIELDHLENKDKENGPATHSDHAIKPGRAIKRRVSAKATDDMNFWQGIDMTFEWNTGSVRKVEINNVLLGQFKYSYGWFGCWENAWVFASPDCGPKVTAMVSETEAEGGFYCGDHLEVRAGDSHKSIWVYRKP